MAYEVEEGVLRIVRWFDAVPERVFRSFVDPREVGRWMWAGTGENPRADIDLRLGGSFRIAVDAPQGEPGWKGGDVAMAGVYVEIMPGRRLVYTLHWEADVGYNQPGSEVRDEAVIVELTPERGGTSMEFTQLGIPDDGASASEHGKGTEAAFDMLESLLAAG